MVDIDKIENPNPECEIETMMYIIAKFLLENGYDVKDVNYRTQRVIVGDIWVDVT